MIDDGKDYCVIVMHRVDGTFDTGELVAQTEKIYIPDGANVIDMHKLSSPIAGKFVASTIPKLIQRE